MERANPFDDLDDLAASIPIKPVDAVAIDQLAETSGFLSRQPKKVGQGKTERSAPQSLPRPARRRYVTGRNCQFNIKATAETVERFYRLANERKVKALGELLEQALDALEAAAGKV